MTTSGITLKAGKFLAGLILAAVAAAALAPSAHAFPPIGTPITVNPGALGAMGTDSTAIYVFADASNTSQLVLTGFGGNPIFTNNSGTPAGAEVDLGVLSGPQVFGLNNLTTGTDFLANVADSAGDYHAYYTPDCVGSSACNTEYQIFSEGNLDPAVAAAIDALPAGTPVVLVGWEDLTAAQNSDFDYNDLIFAFTNLNSPTSTPEPATLGLLGAGLAGMILARRRRK
jgi:PEP-CTERM motif